MDSLNKKEGEQEKQGEDCEDYLNIPEYEQKRIKEAIAKSDTEKFHLFTRLMRVDFMLKNAVIIK